MTNELIRNRAVGAIALIGLMSAACTSDDQSGLEPTGSNPVITSQDSSALYVATADDGVVARVNIADMAVQQLPVSGEPTRVARIDDRVFVTLRTERALLELIDRDGQLVPGRRVTVGAEPVGVVASPSGHLFVAVSMSGRVLELDSDSLETLRIWETPGEPRWLALNKRHNVLFVAGAQDATLLHIDLTSGQLGQTEVKKPRRPSPFTGQLVTLTRASPAIWR